MSAPAATGFMEIDRVRLEYVWHGPPPEAQPTIVLMHEGLGCVAAWRDFPRALADATGCGVLAYSRQGYGASDPVPRPVSHMHDEAEQVLPKVIDHWGLKKVFLVGHSDGASIAAIYAGGVQDHRVRGLVLMTPHFFNEEACIAGVTRTKTAYESGDLKQKLARHHGSNVDLAFCGWSEAWLDPGFRDWSIVDRLQYIRIPVVLIWCAKDPYASLDQVEAAREACTCPLEVVVLEDGIHWPFREESDRTLDAVNSFISRMMIMHGETVSP
ncbi:MAG: alpha/beta fold hydrolase [Hyphomicrobiales bacterium]